MAAKLRFSGGLMGDSQAYGDWLLYSIWQHPETKEWHLRVDSALKRQHLADGFRTFKAAKKAAQAYENRHG